MIFKWKKIIFPSDYLIECKNKKKLKKNKVNSTLNKYLNRRMKLKWIFFFKINLCFLSTWGETTWERERERLNFLFLYYFRNQTRENLFFSPPNFPCFIQTNVLSKCFNSKHNRCFQNRGTQNSVSAKFWTILQLCLCG